MREMVLGFLLLSACGASTASDDCAARVAALSGCGEDCLEELLTAQAEGCVELSEGGKADGVLSTDGILRRLSKAFACDPDREGATFDASQDLRSKLASQAIARDMHDQAQAIVDLSYSRIHELIEGPPRDDRPRGFRYLERRAAAGRHVIFSDLHVQTPQNRQEFFARSGNLALYAELLEDYYDAGYTLVENGDIEDLVILEPNDFPGDMERRAALDLDGLIADREVTRLAQLRMIHAAPLNQPWLRMLERFDRERRLVRIAGNHDIDLQRPELLAVLHERLPNVAQAHDVLVLEDGAGRPAFVILHGHQFDLASHPELAPRFGELYSESTAIWFQGPDRTWTWADDGPASWVAGRQNVMNWLVEDEAAHSEDDRLIADLIEGLLGHNVAWEYFDADTVLGALLWEVIPGKRFFKFRHMDERDIRRGWLAEFPQGAPTLILGHSHEARRDAYSPDSQSNWSGYLNTGAAGRFENLIWAVEVEAGQARLVSWNRSPSSGVPERREWRLVGQMFLAPLPAARVP